MRTVEQQHRTRLVVPDIARGLALLGIAVANAISYWLTPLSTTVTGEHPGTVADQAATVFAAMFVHVRGLPMFSTLLGFGFGLVAASLARKGYPGRCCPARAGEALRDARALWPGTHVAAV